MARPDSQPVGRWISLSLRNSNTMGFTNIGFVLGNSGDFPGACKLERTTLIVVKWLAQDLCAGSAYSSLVVIEVLALSVVDPD
jgi:hypothetical protein